MVDVVRVGKENFQVAVGPETHSTSLMVVDRWGRYRDRIDWEQAPELDRLMKLVDTCVAETEPPAGRTLRTRRRDRLDRGRAAASARTNDR
ncbi:MAG: hypothetical protein R3B96_17420 [Pirellulaceae bacterium]